MARCTGQNRIKYAIKEKKVGMNTADLQYSSKDLRGQITVPQSTHFGGVTCSTTPRLRNCPHVFTVVGICFVNK